MRKPHQTNKCIDGEANSERGSVSINPTTDSADYTGCLIGSSLNIFGRVAPGVSHHKGYGELNTINEDESEQSSNYWEGRGIEDEKEKRRERLGSIVRRNMRRVKAIRREGRTTHTSGGPGRPLAKSSVPSR